MRPISVELTQRTFETRITRPRNQNSGHKFGNRSTNLKYVTTYQSEKTHILKQLRAGLLNVRSVRNKTGAIYDHTIEENLDIFVFTETWLTDYDCSVIAKLTPAGYAFKHTTRDNRRGGGDGSLVQKRTNRSTARSKYTTF